MPALQFPGEKITDDRLQQFAREESAPPVTVLIELDLPEPKVRLEKHASGGSLRYRPVQVELEAPADQEEARRRTEAASNFLSELLTTTPRWLPAAHTFIAEVTPDQLRQIAQSSYVRAIHPNRSGISFPSGY